MPYTLKETVAMTDADKVEHLRWLLRDIADLTLRAGDELCTLVEIRQRIEAEIGEATGA